MKPLGEAPMLMAILRLPCGGSVTGERSASLNAR